MAIQGPNEEDSSTPSENSNEGNPSTPQTGSMKSYLWVQQFKLEQEETRKKLAFKRKGEEAEVTPKFFQRSPN